MRTLAFIVPALALALLSACGGKPAASTSDSALTRTPIEHATATLVVAGLGCPLCAHNIDKVMLDTRGVTSAKVDLAAGTVALTLDADEAKRPSRAVLAKAVEDAGFTVTEIKAP